MNFKAGIITTTGSSTTPSPQWIAAPPSNIAYPPGKVINFLRSNGWIEWVNYAPPKWNKDLSTTLMSWEQALAIECMDVWIALEA